MTSSLTLTRSMAACAAALAPTLSLAQTTPADLSDLVGARGSSGETQMQARGYRLVRSTLVQGQSWTFWWSDVQRQCVSIATSDGRYASIQRLPDQNCNPGGSAAGGAAAAPQQQPNIITLVCYGQGHGSESHAETRYEWNKDRNHYEPQTRDERRSTQFSSAVQVEIRDGQGRIHLGQEMLPPINSGDTDGWWRLDKLRLDENRISGSYKLNFLNSPDVVIDRRTGLIDIDGQPSFSGKCDVGDWGAGRKF